MSASPLRRKKTEKRSVRARAGAEPVRAMVISSTMETVVAITDNSLIRYDGGCVETWPLAAVQRTVRVDESQAPLFIISRP